MSRLLPLARRMPPLAAHLGYRTVKGALVLPGTARYLRDRRAYRALPDSEALRWRDAFPKVTDGVLSTPYDAHYLYQDTWAAHRVAEQLPERHVDVGSRVEFACFLTAVVPVAFVDIRPLDVTMHNLESIAGSVLSLPFESRSLPSVSCLHVAEHIGLGRYGDPLDPRGTRKAIAELQRVTALGGRVLFSVPVGRPRTCFNAHRVHDPRDIAALFDELELVEFAGIDDAGQFRRHRSLCELADQSYACGLYDLRRTAV